MNIKELYEMEVMERENKKLEADMKRRKVLTTEIERVLQNERLKRDIESTSIKFGVVTVTGFGCLCQGGFCSWQKGFTRYLEDIHKEWKKKGVNVRYGIDGVHFEV